MAGLGHSNRRFWAALKRACTHPQGALRPTASYGTSCTSRLMTVTWTTAGRASAVDLGMDGTGGLNTVTPSAGADSCIDSSPATAGGTSAVDPRSSRPRGNRHHRRNRGRTKVRQRMTARHSRIPLRHRAGTHPRAAPTPTCDLGGRAVPTRPRYDIPDEGGHVTKSCQRPLAWCYQNHIPGSGWPRTPPPSPEPSPPNRTSINHGGNQSRSSPHKPGARRRNNGTCSRRDSQLPPPTIGSGWRTIWGRRPLMGCAATTVPVTKGTVVGSAAMTILQRCRKAPPSA